MRREQSPMPRPAPTNSLRFIALIASRILLFCFSVQGWLAQRTITSVLGGHFWLPRRCYGSGVLTSTGRGKVRQFFHRNSERNIRQRIKGPIGTDELKEGFNNITDQRRERVRTIRDMAEDFYDAYKLQLPDSATFAEYAINHLNRLLGAKMLVDFNEAVVVKYQNERHGEKAAPKTINEEVGLRSKQEQSEPLRRTIRRRIRRSFINDNSACGARQGMLRHAGIKTTGDVYVQMIERSVLAAVNSHTSAVLGNWKIPEKTLDPKRRNLKGLNEIRRSRFLRLL